MLGLVIGGPVSFLSVLWGYPWVYTAIFGERGEVITTVTGWRNRVRSSCSGPYFDERYLLLSPRALCMPEPKPRVGSKLHIIGPKTLLGINADTFYTDP